MTITFVLGDPEKKSSRDELAKDASVGYSELSRLVALALIY